MAEGFTKKVAKKIMPEFQYKGRKYNNAAELALALIGGKWKMPILWRLREHPMRYGALKRSLGRISHKMLAEQLQELEKESLIRRKVYPTVPPSVEYSLTPRGSTSIPVITVLRSWGENMRQHNASRLVRTP
jgi:DNA-binding HxlR family transcriptional regulator